MTWRELALPIPMRRVAIVAPRARLRDSLVRIAEAGTVELVGTLPPAEGEVVEAMRRVERSRPESALQPPRVALVPVDVGRLERAEARGLLAGEAELLRRSALARPHGSFAVLVGWMADRDIARLGEGLGPLGGGVVELPRPRWVDPPTSFGPTPVRRAFRPLVTTYGVARYADVDVTPFAAVSFMVMFGMMFGDVGHGLVLAVLGLMLRRAGPRLAAFRPLWPFLVGSGLVAAVFGLLYGEAFGPTGLVPTLWLNPIDDIETLLVTALGVGVALLAISHAYGIVNRWREQGPRAALFSQTGVAGLGVLLGIVVAGLGVYVSEPVAVAAGAGVALVGAVLMAIGFAAAVTGGVGLVEAGIELVDALVRVVSNLLSFTRLAAFGLMHAALGLVVLDAARSVWGTPVGVVLAAIVFLAGNAVAFSLELLVTGVQALRLEFYELFSRVFTGEGHPFAPWALPVTEEVS